MMSYVKNGIWYEEEIFPNISLIILNNLYHVKQHLKINLRCLERILSEKLPENGKNSAIRRHTSKMIWYDIKMKMFLKYVSDHSEQLLPWGASLNGRRIYHFNKELRNYGGVVPPPFWHVKNWYFYWWYKVETLQVVRLAFLV